MHGGADRLKVGDDSVHHLGVQCRSDRLIPCDSDRGATGVLVCLGRIPA